MSWRDEDRAEREHRASQLGWLHVFHGWMPLSFAAFCSFVMLAFDSSAADPQSLQVLPFLPLPTGVSLPFVITCVLGLAAGFGLLTRQPWARGLALVAGLLGFAVAPMGRLMGGWVGLYTMWVLLQEMPRTSDDVQ